LAQDTGPSTTDNVTSDPTVTGRVFDASGVAAFDIRIDKGGWTDACGLVRNGFFTLRKADLEALTGTTLEDGRHTVAFRATAGRGNTSSPHSLTFTLDTTPPGVLIPGLSAESDTGALHSDRVTADPTPTVVLHAPVGYT